MIFRLISELSKHRLTIYGSSFALVRLYLCGVLFGWLVNDKCTAKIVALNCKSLQYAHFAVSVNTLNTRNDLISMHCFAQHTKCYRIYVYNKYRWFINGQTHKHVITFLANWWWWWWLLLLDDRASHAYDYECLYIDCWGVNYLHNIFYCKNMTDQQNVHKQNSAWYSRNIIWCRTHTPGLPFWYSICTCFAHFLAI